MIYRQRLIWLGYWGCVLLLACPFLLAVVATNFIEEATSRYGSPDYFAYGLGYLLFTGGFIAGGVLVLIGREHYSYTPEDAPLAQEVLSGQGDSNPAAADNAHA